MPEEVHQKQPQDQTIPDLAESHSLIRFDKVPGPPDAESGFTVDIDTLKDTAGKLTAEHNSLVKVTSAGPGSLTERVRIATNKIAPQYGAGALGYYPAAQGLAETFQIAAYVIGTTTMSLGIGDRADMVRACARL